MSICLTTPARCKGQQMRTVAVKASWASLGLALGCMCIFFIWQQLDEMSPFNRTKQGVLTGFLPGAVLYGLWAGEALAVVVGIGSFLLIRRKDITSKAIIGIVMRTLCGIAVGLFGVIFFWLIVGHTKPKG
jgi:hypothetical protein